MQYQYLKKDVKRQVDEIVDALAELPQVAACYEAWNRCKDELDGYYSSRARKRLPLSQQKEFRAVKNMVIREADGLRLGVMTFEDEDMDDEPEQDTAWEDAYYKAKEMLCDDLAGSEEIEEAVAALESLADAGSSEAAYLLGKVWRDGLCAPSWDEEAEKWFRVAAERGNSAGQYALGKLCQEQGRMEEAVAWYERAAMQRNEFAQYRLAKLYLTGDGVPKDVGRAVELLETSAGQGNPHAEYLLGKLYLQGEAVERDVGRAEHWLSQAAYQGHAYAQFFLDHIDEARKPSVMLAVTRLLHHLGNIFRENPPAAT